MGSFLQAEIANCSVWPPQSLDFTLLRPDLPGCQLSWRSQDNNKFQKYVVLKGLKHLQKYSLPLAPAQLQFRDIIKIITPPLRHSFMQV